MNFNYCEILEKITEKKWDFVNENYECKDFKDLEINKKLIDKIFNAIYANAVKINEIQNEFRLFNKCEFITISKKNIGKEIILSTKDNKDYDFNEVKNKENISEICIKIYEIIEDFKNQESPQDLINWFNDFEKTHKYVPRKDNITLFLKKVIF